MRSGKRLKAFSDLIHASLEVIGDIPFEVETDASDYAIAAMLSQGGRPVAYMSRSLKQMWTEILCSWKRGFCYNRRNSKVVPIPKDGHFISWPTNVLLLLCSIIGIVERWKNTKIMVCILDLGQLNHTVRHRLVKENVSYLFVYVRGGQTCSTWVIGRKRNTSAPQSVCCVKYSSMKSAGFA